MIAQSGEGLKGPSTAPAGGTIEISVGPNETTVEVSMGGPGAPASLKVPPSKKVTIPVPSLPGEVMAVTVGTGFATRTILITIVASSP